MIVITSPDEMTRYADSARQSRERIALVPTMGFLHDGHLALMREGRRESSVLVASKTASSCRLRSLPATRSYFSGETRSGSAIWIIIWSERARYLPLLNNKM